MVYYVVVNAGYDIVGNFGDEELAQSVAARLNEAAGWGAYSVQRATFDVMDAEDAEALIERLT